MALYFDTGIYLSSCHSTESKFYLVIARKTLKTIYNMVQNCYKPNYGNYIIIFSFLFSLAFMTNNLFCQQCFFIHYLALFFFLLFQFLISFHGAPYNNNFFFRLLYPIKNNQLQQLKRMAITPLYGSHITIVSGGPRGLEPHAHRIIWIDPWDPQPTHVYIID